MNLHVHTFVVTELKISFENFVRQRHVERLQELVEGGYVRTARVRQPPLPESNTKT